MNYDKYLDKIRNVALQFQGKSLKQILLRSATDKAKALAGFTHSAEEIFHALSESIYEAVNEMTADEQLKVTVDADLLRDYKEKVIDSVAEDFAWDEAKYVMLEGCSDNDEKLISVLLENQRNYMLAQQEVSESNRYMKIFTPMVARIYRNLPVRNLVGFQPLDAPVGLAYSLQFKGAKDDKIQLEIISSAVEAGTKKLRAGWTIAALQDLEAFHGLDLEAEMIAALAAEVRAEITNEIINDLRNLAQFNGKEKTTAKLKGSLTEQRNNVGIHVNRAANEIARNTRRGTGNWMIVSPEINDLISAKDNSAFEKEESSSFSNDGMLHRTGTLNGTIKVFVSTVMREGEVLVGYKGKSETDTGYVNCPYVPLISSGIVMNPETFEPVVSLMTRYGKHTRYCDKDDDVVKMSDSRNYYELIDFKSKYLVRKDEE